MRHVLYSGYSSSLYSVFLVGFIYTLHMTLPVYVNSTFLSTLTSESVVGLIYTASSILTIFGFLSMPALLRKIGNYRAAAILILVQIGILYGIITNSAPEIIVPLFVLNLVIIAMIGFAVDIFLEAKTKVAHTGSTRGIFLTVINIAWIMSPLLAGSLISDGNFKAVYIASASLLIPLLYLVRKNLSRFHDAHYNPASILETARTVLKSPDLTKLFSANIILNVFYAWMVVYSPLYLRSLGFDSSEIGLMFTIMLIPFILVEYPLGKIADKKWGEKEIMVAGFIIMAITTAALSLIDDKSFALWALGLFLTRVGASTAEVMIEVYFFKKITLRDSNILGLFRVTRPTAYIIAPLITGLGLIFTSHQYLFVILGILCLFAVYYAATIKDTN